MMSLDEVSILLSRFSQCTLMVVGDLMIDEYLWGHIERISPEAPVPVLTLARRDHTLGGAGNVAKNLRSLGAGVVALGIVGTDEAGACIFEELDNLGVDREGVIEEPDRPSTRKSRLMSLEHGQQVFRYDQETPTPISPEIEDRLLRQLHRKMNGVMGVICSDYLKGVLTKRVLQTSIRCARDHGLPVIIGPKDSDVDKYRGATALIPNLRELEQLAGMKVKGAGDLSQAAQLLAHQAENESLLVTRGPAGMSLFEWDQCGMRQIDIPAVARSVYDVTGAGDTVTSVFTLAIACGATHEYAARLSNLAAGLVVQKRGTASLTPDELLEAVEWQSTKEAALMGCPNTSTP